GGPSPAVRPFSGNWEAVHCSTITIQVPTLTTPITASAARRFLPISALIVVSVIADPTVGIRTGSQNQSRDKDRGGAGRQRLRVAAERAHPGQHNLGRKLSDCGHSQDERICSARRKRQWRNRRAPRRPAGG